jgi:site-specific recombinase XerD
LRTQVDIRTIDFWGFPRSNLRGVFVRARRRAITVPLAGGPPVDAGANDPVFASRKGGHLTERAVNGMVKRTAKRAGINEAVAPHWLRHAHGSHAIDRGASLPEVQSTLGHGNIATTSGYLHARPNTSSGLHLDPGVFFR